MAELKGDRVTLPSSDAHPSPFPQNSDEEVGHAPKTLAEPMAEDFDALENDLEFLKAVTKTTPNSIHIYDLVAKRTVYVNRSLCKLLGYGSAELRQLGLHFYDNLCHPDDLSRVNAHHQHIRYSQADETHIFSLDYRLRNVLGEWRWMYSQEVIFERDRHGQPTQVLGTFMDISDRKAASDRLRNSEMRYRRFYNKTPVMLHSIDPQGIIISVSDYWLHKLGYVRSDVLGQSITDFFTPDSAQHIETVLLPQATEIEACIDVPYQMVSKNGRVLDVLLSAIAERDDSGQFVRLLTVAIDVTERQQTQQELADRAAALARSNADLEEFAYVVSHDLQAPLRAMTIFSQLLQQRYGSQLSDDANTYIEHIVEGGTRMQKMIDGILALSRISHNKQAWLSVNVEDVVETVLKTLAEPIRQARAQITYESLPTIQAESQQIIQLFQNLIGNAIKFCRDETPQIQIQAKRLPECWQFSIQDNGIGIPQSEQTRVFMLFQRSQQSQEKAGYGIGLAICKKIVERHQGEIWLDSCPGKGTTFYFTLPTDELLQSHQEVAPPYA